MSPVLMLSPRSRHGIHLPSMSSFLSFIRFGCTPLLFLLGLSWSCTSASNACYEQRELSVASDVAARAYKDKTSLEQRIAVRIWRAMINAEDKARKSIHSKSFEKYIAIANKKNGEEFFDEMHHLFLSHSMLISCLLIKNASSLSLILFDTYQLPLLLERHTQHDHRECTQGVHCYRRSLLQSQMAPLIELPTHCASY